MRSSGIVLGVMVAMFLLAPVPAEARDGHRTAMVRSGKANVSQLRVKQRGISSYRGKMHVKRLVKRGHVKTARLVLKAMNKRPNRKGIKGGLDKYRKWTARRVIEEKERQIKINKFLAKKHAPIPLYLYPMP